MWWTTLVTGGLSELRKLISEKRRERRRADALILLFENSDRLPYLVEGDTWINGVHRWRRCYRVGLTSAFSEAIDHARLVVESVTARGLTPRPEARLRTSDDHKDSTSLLSRDAAAPIYFDLVEEFVDDRDHPEQNDWAFICHAHDETAPNPMIPFQRTKIVVRAEADNVKPVRMTFAVQERTPRALTLAGEVDVRKTALLVRKES